MQLYELKKYVLMIWIKVIKLVFYTYLPVTIDEYKQAYNYYNRKEVEYPTPL